MKAGRDLVLLVAGAGGGGTDGPLVLVPGGIKKSHERRYDTIGLS